MGKAGIEPAVYLTSRIYSPLQSPLCVLAHIEYPWGDSNSQNLGS